MAKIYDSITETIGNTPIVRLKKLNAGLGCDILAKLDAAPVSSRGTKELELDGVTLLRRVRQQMQDQIEA